MVKKCAQCQSTGRMWAWTVQCCADGRRKRKALLCDSCDIARNRELLILMNDRNVEAKMTKYAKKVRDSI